MPATVEPASVSNRNFRAGRMVSGMVAPIIIFDGGTKPMKPPLLVKATRTHRISGIHIVRIGAVLLVSSFRSPPPVRGAVLLTAHPGGAVAANVRVGSCETPAPPSF
jgi:hypothetical protein